MINVGFDGTCLKHPRTGVGTYTFCLINHLANSDISINILDGVRYRNLGDYAHDYSDAEATEPGALQLVSDIARKSTLLRKLYRRFVDYHFHSAVKILDIYHATNFLPARRVNVPVLPLIHDVSHLRHPDWHPRQRVELLTGRAAEFTDAPLINTVSKFSAGEIAETLSIPPERIRITPPGTNPLYFGEPDQAESVLRELDLAQHQYFLSVGTLEPRKNLATVLSAYIELRRQGACETPLVIVGPQGWGDLNFPDGTEALQRSGHVLFLGYVTERIMHALYANATAFLYPSLYEGFGMPVTESMATGTRPIVATGGAPQEVAGDEGFCVPALDTAAWQVAMREAIDGQWSCDPDRRSRLKRRAGSFTWQENAAKTLAIYHEIAGLQQAA